MNFTGSTRVFMILGDPLALVQVQAPDLDNSLCRQHGVAAVRVPAHVAAADLCTLARQLMKARSNDPGGFALVINASPLGLNAHDPLPFDVDRLDPDAAVVDILMKHLSTPLLRACHARGITAHAGHEMLVQQTPEYLSLFLASPKSRRPCRPTHRWCGRCCCPHEFRFDPHPARRQDDHHPPHPGGRCRRPRPGRHCPTRPSPGHDQDRRPV